MRTCGIHLSAAFIALIALILIVAGIQEAEDQNRMLAHTRQLKEQLKVRREEAETEMLQTEDIGPQCAGFLLFESGLIEEPVMQCSDNSYYLSHHYDGSEGIAGALFLDAACQKDDDLRIIYGHTVFSDQTLMFSPLHQLLDPVRAHENRYFVFQEKENTGRYEIINVFVYDEYQTDLIENAPFVFESDETKNAFLQKINAYSVYRNPNDGNNEGKLLILQTCLKEEGGERIGVLAVSQPH